MEEIELNIDCEKFLDQLSIYHDEQYLYLFRPQQECDFFSQLFRDVSFKDKLNIEKYLKSQYNNMER